MFFLPKGPSALEAYAIILGLSTKVLITKAEGLGFRVYSLGLRVVGSKVEQL